MNLALGVIVIFIIAIPGIIFRLTYLSSHYSKRTINTTAVEEIFNSLFPAFFFHGICIVFLIKIGEVIDFQFIYNLLIGNNTAKNIDVLNNYIGTFLFYIFCNILLNYASAQALRYYVLKYRLYNKIPFLTIYNKWYHVLKPPNGDNSEISVWVDVLVETKNDSVLYRGFITDFWLDRDGGICELHIENVRRREFKNDEKQLSEDEIIQRYYNIPGERFIIKYQDVKNMNLIYYESEIN